MIAIHRHLTMSHGSALIWYLGMTKWGSLEHSAILDRPMVRGRFMTDK